MYKKVSAEAESCPTEDQTSMEEKKPRGFARMDPEKHREIARKGGANVPNDKRSFSRDRVLAATAGRKGGIGTPPESRSFSLNRELARDAGRKGRGK